MSNLTPNDIDAAREWQPIETAPRDGTPVLVCGDEGVQLVAWLDNNTEPRGRRFMEWCEPGSWQDEQGGYNTADNVKYWMLLPDPPEDNR